MTTDKPATSTTHAAEITTATAGLEAVFDFKVTSVGETWFEMAFVGGPQVRMYEVQLYFNSSVPHVMYLPRTGAVTMATVEPLESGEILEVLKNSYYTFYLINNRFYLPK